MGCRCLEPAPLTATAYNREDEEEQQRAKRSRVFCCSGPACSQLAQHNVEGLQRAWMGSAALALSFLLLRNLAKPSEISILTMASPGYPQAGLNSPSTGNSIPRASSIPGPSASVPLHWSCTSLSSLQRPPSPATPSGCRCQRCLLAGSSPCRSASPPRSSPRR